MVFQVNGILERFSKSSFNGYSNYYYKCVLGSKYMAKMVKGFHSCRGNHILSFKPLVRCSKLRDRNSMRLFLNEWDRLIEVQIRMRFLTTKKAK